MSQYIQEFLQPSINLGLDESKFWDMTIAELERWQEGALSRMKTQAQFDYMLANLIGISVARIYKNNLQYPTIEKVYPELFKEEKDNEPSEQEIAQNNINRFLNFAIEHNKRMTKGDGEISGS